MNLEVLEFIFLKHFIAVMRLIIVLELTLPILRMLDDLGLKLELSNLTACHLIELVLIDLLLFGLLKSGVIGSSLN